MIPDALVEATWQECAALAPKEARRRLAEIRRRQPALFAHVFAQAEVLTQPATELTVYLFFVIAQMFYRHCSKVRRVSPSSVIACAEDIETRVGALQGAHEAFLERAAVVLSGRQPHVFRYLVEAIIEAPTAAIDPVPLSPEEQGALFLILATAITVLDDHGASKGSP